MRLMPLVSEMPVQDIPFCQVGHVDEVDAAHAIGEDEQVQGETAGTIVGLVADNAEDVLFSQASLCRFLVQARGLVFQERGVRGLGALLFDSRIVHHLQNAHPAAYRIHPDSLFPLPAFIAVEAICIDGGEIDVQMSEVFPQRIAGFL